MSAEFQSNYGMVIGDQLPGSRNSAAYSPSSSAERTERTNPDFGHWQPDIVFDETNMTDGVYDVYVSMDTFRKLYIQLVLDGGSGTVTVVLEATAQFTDGDPSALDYDDIGLEVFGAATFTASDFLGDNLEKLAGATWVHIEITASTGGANDADARVDTYRLY
jgi:hypothetical protein